MRKNILTTVLIIGGLIVLYLAISSKQENKKVESVNPEPSVYKIGFIGPLTGDAASLGTVTRTSVELAVEEVNNSGGINGKKLEAVYEDGKCDSKTATSAANKLININKVHTIIGGLCSSETSAFSPAAMSAKVPVISYCSSAPNLSKTGKYFFRNYPSDLHQGKFAAEYLYANLGSRKVAILYHISDWGTGLKDVFEKRFKELGGVVVAIEGATQDSRDYRTQLTKIKNTGADLIYTPTYPEGAEVLVKQAAEMNVTTRMLGGDTWSDPKFQKAVSGVGELFYSEGETPEQADFVNKLKAKTKDYQVPICSAQAYDAVKMAAKVLSVAKDNPDRFEQELRRLNYNGVSGKVSFDENGDITRADYMVKQIKNGTAVKVGSPQD